MMRISIMFAACIAFAVAMLSPGQAGASTQVPHHSHHRKTATMPPAPAPVSPAAVYVPPPPEPCLGGLCLMWW